MRDKERRYGPARLVDRMAQWCGTMLAALGARMGSRRAKAALAALALVLSNLLGALTPVAAYAALNFEPITLETVPESEMEDGAYSWSINFTGWDESSAVGFRRVEHPEGFIAPTNGMRDYARTAAGWAAEIGPDTPKGSFSVRATGGQYGSTPIDAIITLSDWTYEEPRGGWGTIIDRGSWPEFTTGVFMFDGLSQTYLPDKPASVTGVESLNFYTIGLTDLVVDVEFVRAGTNTPVEMRGHLTTTDLDVWQSFSFGGAVNRGRIAQGNPVLGGGGGGGGVVGGSSNLSVTDPVDYKNGLVEAYFDTSGGKKLKFYFGTSWAVPDGTTKKTFESVFWLTPEYLTVPPADVDGGTTVTKSADKTGENRITVGDEVEYVVDYQAHEQGENCRWGYRYTALQIVDELPAEMRYVEGSARLLDGSGADVTAQAGAVVTDSDANTVSFEFSEGYLGQMPMEGEHYRLTFKAALAEYPANGDLFVITEKGFGKRTPVSEYPEHKRGGQGVYTIAMTAKKGNLVACRVVGPQHELMVVSEEGVVIRVKSGDVSRLGRSTQGVKVMNMVEGDHVSAVARMVARKKKAPKHDEAQGMLDLAAAGAKDADEPESVDIGGDEELSDDLIDEEE